MQVRIVEEPIEELAGHARVSSAFTVRVRMRVEAGRLVEEPVRLVWEKDYDADGEGPRRWAARFDVSRWGLLVARDEGERIGGAVLAWRTPALVRLEGRGDVAVLWDLRVAPGSRRRGVGRALFARAAEWARVRGCTRLDVETQDVNVPACRFYAGRGCTLRRVEPHAYPSLPDETQLLFSLSLP